MMLREAIDRILDIRPFQTVEIDGKTYTDGRLHRINPNRLQSPEALPFHTLTGIVDFLQSDNCRNGFVGNGDAPSIHVVNYNHVRIIGNIDVDSDNVRFNYAKAILDNPQFGFGRFMGLEDFIVSLQSQFIHTEQIDDIIGMLGSLANEQVVENKDDGFSQSINIRTGITTKSRVKIKNPLKLKPYRTFREIDQPSSNCILRLKKNNDGLFAGLWEADGDQWKLEAIGGIKAFFEKTVSAEIPILA